uniref:Reverse transcriptase Ty1/copia-type domain-containing protein n=1 Tax=Tanacetum cinerariifolium TaxID=118510 RepID=A0A699GVJ7_TANCI|nr:hypothetical protein [Tanacetum cinerariifolium]
MPFCWIQPRVKKKKIKKEVESSKEPKHKESKSTSSSKDAPRSQPKSSGKSAHVEEHDVDQSQWNLSSSATLDREWHKTKAVDNRPPQPWITQMAQAGGTQSSFNEFLATPINFSSFIMNRIKINNMTQENECGCQVIPWDYFINNDLEYLKGRSSGQKYITSITKMKVADYGQVKWIEDKGPKHQKFYGYASNMETSKDVYSRHMIIRVTSLKIMKYFGYNHLEEIIIRRQDDQLYKFREVDLKRLRRQDIEDMLLLLVQDKLSNLNLEERYALNVALRMFTQHIVIQERVEDLQLGVKSYQKKINLTRPDTYHSDLKRMTPYTAYFNVQGIIYEDEMKRNRIMRTNELHKFSNDTLNHVRTVLNDIATGIEMDYLPKRKWSKHDNQRARVMINVIDKKLKDRRLMRNLEKFVGGRPYEEDLRLLVNMLLSSIDLSYAIIIYQMIDYALWEVIENGETLSKTQVVEGVTTMMPITTVEEKAQRRIQKLVSQSELLDEKLSQEDVNEKLLRINPLGYSISEKENLHIRFSGNTPNVVGSGPDCLFDIDALTRTMNYEPIVADPKSTHFDGSKTSSDDGKKVDEDPRKENECNDQEKKDNVNSTNNVNTVSSTFDVAGINEDNELLFDLNMPALEDVSLFNFLNDDEDVSIVADMNNLDTRIQEELKKKIYALKDPSWIEAMQDELLQLKLQEGTHKKKGIDYDEVFAPVARIEAIRLFLAYASFKDFVVYQMDVKSAFLYGKIKEEVYVCQPPGFKDPDFPDRVYKVEKALYGLHQALKAWYETLSTYLLDNGFQTGKIDKTLFIKRHKVKQKKDEIFISQDKYVAEILKKFGFIEVKTASKPIGTQKPLLKDEDGEEVDVHMYMSMIGSLMYHTASRPDIMFAVCACARYQVNPKSSHLYDVKKSFSLQTRVLDLEKTKTTQSNEIASLKRRVQKLKKKNRSRTHKLKRLYKVGLTARLESSRDEESLGEHASKQERKINAIDQDEDITIVNVQDDAEMFDVNDLGGEEVFVAEQEVVKDVNENIVEEVVNAAQDNTATTTITTEEITLSQALKALKTSKPKVKGIVIHEQEEAAKIDDDHQLAERLQAQEQKELSDAEKLHYLYSSWRKEESTLQSELVERKEKRAGEELIQESTKKQKVKDDKEMAELKKIMKIIQDKKEVAIDAIHLAVKSLRIVDWKIHKERKKSYYQIVRADGKTQIYIVFSKMLESFKDLEDLYKLVKAKFKSTRPVEDLDLLLWGDLKTMFEPHVEDKVTRITAAHVYVNAAKLELVLLVNFNEKYNNCLLLLVKENQEKDKIGSKPEKNRKRGEAEKSQKQLQ